VILFVSPLKHDQEHLIQIFSGSQWKLVTAETLRRARAFLLKIGVGAVISEEVLPDGNWRDVKKHLHTLPVWPKPQLVVTCAQANDKLWSEVLNEGGYDVLAQPFARDEVLRVMQMAQVRQTSISQSSGTSRD
jgi:DNA-binding NtrC family response regulator